MITHVSFGLALLAVTTLAAPQTATMAAPQRPTVAAPQKATTAAPQKATTAAPQKATMTTPQEATTAAQQNATTKPPIKIIAQTSVRNPDGSYEWSYETENGIFFREKGTLIPADKPEEGFVIAVVGSASYVLDGTPITLTYTADKSGFQAQGDHLPTPPPVPEEIQKGLDLILSQTPKPEQQPRGGAPPSG